MRAHRLTLLGIPAMLALAAPLFAQPSENPHLASGEALLDDEDFAAARAEFEAAYQAQPGARALLAITRCERALFRYPQAIAALTRALREHGASMSEAEKKAAEQQLAELTAQMGSVVVETTPADATLRVDGEDLPRGVRTIPLGPGSHRLEARMPGYAPAAQTITVTSGATVSVRLRLSAEPAAGAAVEPKQPSRPRGPYALAAFTGFLPVAPADFSGTAVGVSAGARVGYRFASIVGGELGFEYAHVGCSGRGEPSFNDAPSVTYPLSYSLSSFRFGLHVRLMTTGKVARFVQTFGGGVMLDSVSWTAVPNSPGREGAKGVDGFGVSETGVELEVHGVLLGLTAQQLLGSSGALDLAEHDAYTANTFGGPQYTFGLGLRAGYRWW